MNVIVIGLGSMGKRRIGLLKQNYSEINVYGVDMSETRRNEAADIYGITTFSDIEDVLNFPCFCAFVCTAPLSHHKIINRCLSAGLHVFTELNLISDGYFENMSLAKQQSKTLFMSSTFLYREDIRYLMEKIKKSDTPLFYTYHVGQYLPDWHPWESFKDFFVGEKRTSGCREILAIEMPWLLRAFGDIVSMSVHCRNMSSLRLTYPDTYWLHFEHINGTVGQLTVDLVSRVPVRHFETFSDNLQLEWRGKPEELWVAAPDYRMMQKVDLLNVPHRKQGYRDFIVEDAYLEEIRMFFAVAQGDTQPTYTFYDDLHTLDVIDRILGEKC